MATGNRLQVTQIGLGTTNSTQDLLKLEYDYGTGTQNNGSLRQQKITVPTAGANQGFTAVQNYLYDDLNRLKKTTETIESQMQGRSLLGGGGGARPMSDPCDWDPDSCEPEPNEPPVSVPGEPYSATVGQNIQFNGSGSYDPDGWITSYLWNFGDGTTSTAANPQKSYASAGTYNVSLRVRDNSLVYDYGYTTATVSAAPTPTPTPTPTPAPTPTPIPPDITWQEEFDYDRYGNRRFNAAGTTTITGCAEAVCNPTVSTANNRFSTGQGYSYDANGAVTRDATGQRFGYDAEGRQNAFFSANNSGSTPDATYQFDGDGKRVRKTSATENTVFVYDAGGMLIEEWSGGAVQTTYVYAEGRLLATETSAGTNYLTADHLGSPRVVTTGSGAVTSRKDFSPFGEEISTPQRTAALGYQPSGLRQDYTGYQKDNESGLEFAQARYYSSLHGRFTSADPLTASIATKNPQTFNRYSYVLNSPYKFADPLGLLPVSAGSYGGCSAEFSSCDENGNGVGVDEYSRRIYQTEIARLEAQQAFARGDTERGWQIIRDSEGALQALDQNGNAVQDPNEPTVTAEATVLNPDEEDFVVSNIDQLEKETIAGNISYLDGDNIAQCARLPIAWQLDQEETPVLGSLYAHAINNEDRTRRLSENWIKGLYLVWGYNLKKGTVIATFGKDGKYAQTNAGQGGENHTAIFLNWEERGGVRGLRVIQQMSDRNGKAQIGFIPFIKSNPYYSNAYRFNVVRVKMHRGLL